MKYLQAIEPSGQQAARNDSGCGGCHSHRSVSVDVYDIQSSSRVAVLSIIAYIMTKVYEH